MPEKRTDDESDKTFCENICEHEKNLVLAYRRKPEMQGAVDKLLNIDEGRELKEFLEERSKFLKDSSLPFAASNGDVSRIEQVKELYEKAERDKNK